MGRWYYLFVLQWLTLDHVYERSFPIYDEVPDYAMQVHDGIHSFIRPNKTIHLLVGTGGIDLGIKFVSVTENKMAGSMKNLQNGRHTEKKITDI